MTVKTNCPDKDNMAGKSRGVVCGGRHTDLNSSFCNPMVYLNSEALPDDV